MLLTSSLLQPPTDYFEGYCFAGADFISDDAGARTYESATGNRLGPGNDGCYSIVRHTSIGLEIGTDGRGSTKLFLYSVGTTWAVSTSLPILVDFLRAKGIDVPHRTELLRALNLPGSFTQQQITLQTIYAGIRLVPSFEKVVITSDGARTEQAIETFDDLDYESALAQHISTWGSRLHTVMADPEAVLTVDLSGGRDSRACFAFAQSTGLLETASDRFRLSSNKASPEDLKAASRIAGEYGHELNTAVRPPSETGSAKRAVRRWHENSMGVYLPVYLHARQRDPLRLQLHGAGGGNFRPLYRAADLATKLTSYKRHLPARAYAAFREIAIEDMDELKRKRPDVPELSLHYREFRNRFHFGFSPQCNTLLTPLNSILLDVVTDREGIAANDIYADIMDALVPDLKNLPYDDPKKNPSNSKPSNAALAVRDAQIGSGKIYIGEPPRDNYKPGGQMFRQWLDYAHRALRGIDDSNFLSNTQINELLQFTKEARKLPRRPRANSHEMRLLSYACTVAFATR